jgi:hypothetical protein
MLQELLDSFFFFEFEIRGLERLLLGKLMNRYQKLLWIAMEEGGLSGHQGLTELC